MDDLLTRYNKLLRQYEVLHKENEVLKSLLKIHGIEYETRMKEDMNKPIYSLVSVPTITLSIDERIRLFQSLFKGLLFIHISINLKFVIRIIVYNTEIIDF